MAKKQDISARITEIRNRKASHDYFIGETFEAGIVLSGTEAKSLRAGKAQIQDAFVRIDCGEAILYNCHISEYDFGNIYNHAATRERKLLLHKNQILKLKSEVEKNSAAIIPIRIYFKRGFAKVEIAVCKGKKLYDKRESIKKAEAMREAKRAMSLRNYR